MRPFSGGTGTMKPLNGTRRAALSALPRKAHSYICGQRAQAWGGAQQWPAHLLKTLERPGNSSICRHEFGRADPTLRRIGLPPPLGFLLRGHISEAYFTNQDFTGYDGIVVIKGQ
jgi:hypothetical protein